MLNWLIKRALHNRLVVLMAAMVVILLGVYQIMRLPVEVLPDLTKPTVTILTEAPGKAPEEVEKFVTMRLERAVNGLKGVSRIRSTSDVALSLVFVEFDWGTDIYEARQRVQERLRMVELDEGDDPYLTPVASLMGEIMLIGVSSPSESVSPMELRTFSDWKLRRRIQGLPGVAEALSMGGGIQQVHVLPDPNKMLAYGIGMEEVNSAAAEAASNATGGYINRRNQEQMIRILAMTTDLDDIRSAVVRKINDRIITLGDVAEVRWGIEPQRGDAGIALVRDNGEVVAQPAVILSVTKAEGVDTRRLTEEIEGVMESMSSKLKEDGVDIRLTPLFRQASFIEVAMDNLMEAIFDGAWMVVIVLFVFLFSLRAPLISLSTTLITLSAIPLSFAATAIIFTIFGLSVNSMTLGGLAVAIGIVVDDAIVDVENVLRRLKENASLDVPKPRLEVIAKASGEVRNSIFYATVLIILVFIPLLALSGVEGRLFTPIAVATMVSMAASFVVSMTVIPVLCSLLLRPKAGVVHSDGVMLRFLKKILSWTFMKAALRFPTLTIAVGLILLTASIFLYQRMPKEFLPSFKEETLIVAMATAAGTSLETTQELSLMADKLLQEIPEVKTVGHRAGRAERGDHVVPVSMVEFDIELHEGGRPREEVEKEIRDTMKNVPGTFAAVSGPLTDRIGHMLSGVAAKVAIKVYGEDLDQIRGIAKQVQKICHDIPGLEEAKLEATASIPQTRILFDRQKGEAYGVNAAAFNKQLSGMLGGEEVAELYEGERTIALVTRLPRSLRESPDQLRQLYMDTEDGSQVPLSLIADIQQAKGPNVIKREKTERRIVVSVNPSVRDLESVIGQLQAGIAAAVPESKDYHISIEGEYMAQQDAARKITLWSLVVLGFITVMLFSYFGSMNFAMQVITDIPLSLIGAVAMTWYMDIPISIASMVGFIAVAGISARNSIMLISHYLMLMHEEGVAFGKDLIIRGTQERLLPVLMTAFSAGIALIPLVLALGESGKEILSPIAIAITGGLISSTILGLAITPAVFYVFGRRAAERAMRRKELSL